MKSTAVLAFASICLLCFAQEDQDNYKNKLPEDLDGLQLFYTDEEIKAQASFDKFPFSVSQVIASQK